MDRLREVQEAKDAANEVIMRIDNATISLNKALSWGKWDVVAGEFLTSLIKRKKISKANRDILQISVSLKSLRKELADVNMKLPESVSDTISDKFLDLWFDNIFTDIRVQREIRASLGQLAAFKRSIQALIIKLDSEIEILENEEQEKMS